MTGRDNISARQMSEMRDVPLAQAQLVSAGYGFRTGTLNWIDLSEKVVEVVDVLQITPVAGAAKWFAGLANYRGDLLPVTDMNIWLGLDNESAVGSGRTASRRVLVLENTLPGNAIGSEKVGLLVDEISGYNHQLQFESGQHTQAASETVQSSVDDTDNSVSTDFVKLMSPIDACGKVRVHEILEHLWSGSATLKLVCNLSRLFKSPEFSDIRIRPAGSKAVTAKTDSEAVT